VRPAGRDGRRVCTIVPRRRGPCEYCPLLPEPVLAGHRGRHLPATFLPPGKDRQQILPV